MNNRGLTHNERQQECILSAKANSRANFCIHCHSRAASKILKSHKGCIGYGCRACKTETTIPVATTDAECALVRATFEGKPTAERIVGI